jgi:hypothetical protein
LGKDGPEDIDDGHGGLAGHGGRGGPDAPDAHDDGNGHDGDDGDDGDDGHDGHDDDDDDDGDGDRVEDGFAPAIGVCADCGVPVSEGTCRVFYETPMCPNCFHDMGLMRLALATPPEEDALMARILSDRIGPLSPTQRRRLQGIDKFASLLPQALGGELLKAAASAVGAMDASGILRASVSVRTVLRHGRGAIKADGGSVSVLLYLAGLLTYEVAIAAMVRSGTVRRGPMNDVGEWEYECVEPGGPAPGDVPIMPGRESAFGPYAKDLHASAVTILADLDGAPGVRAEDLAAMRARLEALFTRE